MDAIWTSAVAVAGTLLGSVVTYPFQRLASKQQRLNEERIVAYTAFATAVEAFRYGQAERFFRWQDDPSSDAYRAAYHEGHRLRSVAWQAFYRVQLIADDPAVVRLAREALELTRDIGQVLGHNLPDGEPQNKERRTERNLQAKKAIGDFVAHASKNL